MSEKKDKSESNIPVAVGRTAALLAGAIAGKEAGDGLAKIVKEQFELPEDTAEIVETGLEATGVIITGIAAWNLSKENKDKSVFYGAKALGATGAAIGFKKLLEEVKELRREVESGKEHDKPDDVEGITHTDVENAYNDAFSHDFSEFSVDLLDYEGINHSTELVENSETDHYNNDHIEDYYFSCDDLLSIPDDGPDV